MKRITISIGNQTFKRVSMEAKASARSMAFIIRQIVKDHFAKIDRASREQ